MKKGGLKKGEMQWRGGEMRRSPENAKYY